MAVLEGRRSLSAFEAALHPAGPRSVPIRAQACHVDLGSKDLKTARQRGAFPLKAGLCPGTPCVKRSLRNPEHLTDRGVVACLLARTVLSSSIFLVAQSPRKQWDGRPHP